MEVYQKLAAGEGEVDEGLHTSSFLSLAIADCMQATPVGPWGMGNSVADSSCTLLMTAPVTSSLHALKYCSSASEGCNTAGQIS